MTQLPQIGRRRIGNVEIIDVRGAFVGPWALRGKEELKSILQDATIQCVIVNLKGLSSLDSLGAKAILENLPDQSKAGIIAGNLSVMEMIEKLRSLDTYTIFRNEEDVVAHFGPQLVEERDALQVERRRHQRLRAALPLEFTYTTANGEKLQFRAIITDLSEGGMLAEYLDLDYATRKAFLIDPYDFKLLDLRIKLPGEEPLLAKGKVARTVLTGEQVGLGIEFYDLAQVDREKIRTFLSA